MVVRTETVAKIEKLAAIVPLVMILWAALSWGLHTDAAVKVLSSHDQQYQAMALNGSERLARLEKGQADETARLDRIEGKVDTVLERVK